MSVGSGSSGRAAPRYAPDDPSLPKPWRGLVDGTTGYLYYWNPETNVTQYERPLPPENQLPPPPPPLPPPPPRSRDRRDRSRSRSRTPPRRDHRDRDRDRDRRHDEHASSKSASSHHHPAPAAAVADDPSTEAYRRRHEITITGDNVPAPITSFESGGFPSEILKEIQRAGFASPTPIQAQSWPIAMQNQDVVAIAKTGSGKTLGYLLPGFMHIKRLQNNTRSGPTVLVLAPTRELATQILDEAVKFGRSSRISCTCLYGGAPKGPQLRDLDRGVDVVVATPGRLNDILEMRRVSLKQVSYLVLDEADRMLDMGFEPQIRKIVKEIPHRRQTLMYTATWPKEVRRIADDLLVHPVHVTIGSVDELVANSAITQHVEVITPSEKLRRLEQILRSQDSGSKVLIFCTTKRMCDQLSRTLTRQFGASAIHGDKSQSEREKVLNHFRSGRSPILVATDVAARGLDIKDIRVVINYDFPTGVEDYVHRIGRTGRAGATGVAYTFFCDQDSKYASDLIKILEGANQKVPRDLMDMASRGGGRGRKRNRWASHCDRGGSRSELDSRYSGRDGLTSSGRSESSRGGRRKDDYGGRGRSARGRSRSCSRSDSDRYSRSPKRSRRHEVQARRSRTKSRSRSRSRSYSRNHRASCSRSRSPGASRRYEKSGAGSRSARPDSGHPEHKSSPRAHSGNDHVKHSHLKDDHHLEDGKMEKVDLDRSPSPQDDKSAPYSPVYNGKGSGSMSPNGQPEANAKSLIASDKPDPASPLHRRKSREDEEEGVIDEDGEIAEIDPRASAAVQNGDGN
ncbi:DEAD-box ATP-dependent RNA helicase 40-like [Phragmites australis]|uniref:DEAD-box ATP-dependent RNA helicase 40-like n=1 Tax=Phragmites australis TaxID=29695 RepID=UPI002D7A0218|nr:DEAD-box ATP-dependent RNA helicase 40-like [Phragmites australis]